MQTAIIIISILFSAGTFAPLIPSRHWMIRGHLYLRSSYLIINSFLFIIALIFLNFNFLKIVINLLLLTAIFMGVKSILPFTFLTKKTLKGTRDINPEKGIKLFVFNVYQFNEQYEKCLKKIGEQNPDVVFLLETDDKWYQGLSSLKKDYPFILKEVKDDTYGLLCFSKNPFLEGSIRHVVSEEVPSIDLTIMVGNQKVKIFGVHPKPPSPSEATYSTSKDKELIHVAKEISALPNDTNIILIGDLNDVAWSQMSSKIKEITKMVDPRIGRGFYPTFPTYSPFKIPLDHVFCSPTFELVEFKVLENIGSDHYPVYAHLQLKKRLTEPIS